MSWNDGYITNVEYPPGYYRNQSPDHLALCCLLANTVPSFTRRSGQLTYLELGCGRGRGALCLAASNPEWRVIAVDFMPAHISEAREFAAAAAIDNIQFLEADITTLDPSTLPEIDVVSAHGLWSWVSDSVRAGVVRILANRLRAGGILHLSYNALPAWQMSLGFQRLVRTVWEQSSSRIDRKVEQALDLAEKLGAAGALHLDQGSSAVRKLQQSEPGILTQYLAHEYMNKDWRPCFHADVMSAMSEAKLEYVASAEIFENFPELMLTENQRAICAGIDDIALRELAKDLFLPRKLRQDIYVRGQRWMSDADRDAPLRDLYLMLTRPADDFIYEANLMTGSGSIGFRVYEPVVKALSFGPQRIADLLSLPELGGRLQSPAELVGLLVGTSQAVIVARPEAGIGEAAVRLNNKIAERVLAGETSRGALASLRLGSGLACADNDFVAISLIHQLGEDASTDRWADAIGLAPASPSREQFVKEAEERRRRLLPVWKSAGII